MNNRLAQLRKEKGLSQTDFGKLFNVAQNTISQWEREERNVDIEMLVRLADYYHVSIDYLIGRSEACTPETSQTNTLIDLTDNEIEHIKKYRALDERGKGRIDNALEYEYRQAQEKSDKSSMKISA